MLSRSRKRNVVRVLSELNHRPYKLGSKRISRGLDCFSLVKLYYSKAFGHELPSTFNDYSAEDYADFFLKDRTFALETAVDYLKALPYIVEVSINNFLPFDILFASLKLDHEGLVECSDYPALGIYVGNQHVLTANDPDGTCMMALRQFKIHRVFRVVEAF